MSSAYIVCRRCGYRIATPFRCRCEAPVHFIVTCPKCGYKGVYSDVNIVEQDEKMCRESCEKATSISEKIFTSMGLTMLVDAIATITMNVAQMLTTEEQKEENKKQ